jgi:DNA mismatch repair protein MutL
MKPESEFHSVSGTMENLRINQELFKNHQNYVGAPSFVFNNNQIVNDNPGFKYLENKEKLWEGELAIIGQCFGSYILVEKDESLWLVDQHAAHERIMYNRLLLSSASQNAHSQMLALPLAFDLSTVQMDLLENKMEILREIGFNIETLGPNTAIIRSAPSLLQGREIEVINECLELMENERLTDIKKKIYAMMACKQAIKAGQSLNRQEMAMIINELLQAEDYKNCPHGRPTMLEMSHFDLDKRFKRK